MNDDRTDWTGGISEYVSVWRKKMLHLFIIYLVNIYQLTSYLFVVL